MNAAEGILVTLFNDFGNRAGIRNNKNRQRKLAPRKGQKRVAGIEHSGTLGFSQSQKLAGRKTCASPVGEKYQGMLGKALKKEGPPSRITIERIFSLEDTAGERSAGGRIRIRISSLRDRSMTTFLF